MTSPGRRPTFDTRANWALYNPVLESGATGYETDTDNWKRGNGTDAWNILSYVREPYPGKPDAAPDVANASTDELIAELIARDGSKIKAILTSNYAPLFQGLTAYVAGQVVTVNGLAVQRIAPGTSRASYDATEAALWSPVAAPASGTGSPAAALTTATGRAIAFAVALG